MPDPQVLTSPDQTRAAAARFLARSDLTNVIGLIGELGSGKTVFTQGLGAALKIDTPITSPTFLLMKSYPTGGHHRFRHLVHLDLYRICGWQELIELELERLWADPAKLVVIEWADRIIEHLPDHVQVLRFSHMDGERRSIRFEEPKPT